MRGETLFNIKFDMYLLAALLFVLEAWRGVAYAATVPPGVTLTSSLSDQYFSPTRVNVFGRWIIDLQTLALLLIPPKMIFS